VFGRFKVGNEVTDQRLYFIGGICYLKMDSVAIQRNFIIAN